MNLHRPNEADPLARPNDGDLARISQLVNAGSYRIEPAEVAEAMLREVMGPRYLSVNPTAL